MKNGHSVRVTVRSRCGRIWVPVACCLLAAAVPLQSQNGGIPKAPVDEVNPFIGTAKGGNVFPGADYPFGMLQWSPDDSPKPGGYDYSSNTITGFSLTHFSGRGHAGWEDFPFMPTLEEVKQSPAQNWAHYASTFSHEHEKALAGYYSVVLDTGIKVELTATSHGGMGRFTFPAASPTGTILINAGGSRTGDGDDTEIHVADNQTLMGMASSKITTIKYKIYFAAKFSRTFQSGGTWNDSSVSPGVTKGRGAKTGAYLTFANIGGPVEVKVGISFVSEKNALANLEAEVAGKNFDQTYTQTRVAWNSYLGKIAIEDDNSNNKIVFYSALYHSMLHPNVFSDDNGQYLGFDGKIHQLEAGDVQYENISTWDAWRNQFPLYTLIAPTQARDIIRSLLRDAHEDPGGGMPRWEQVNQNSGGMVGDSPAIFVASAYAYDIRDFDVNSAFDILTKAARDPKVTSGGFPEREDLAEYMSKGYVSASAEFSASIVLEYSNDDFAISRLAQGLGKSDVAAVYLKRAQDWKNLFDPKFGYIVPKSGDGQFVKNYQLSTDDGFKEGTAQQYTWMVPFNFQGLFDLMGGKQEAVKKLDQLFAKLTGGSHTDHANMGNEPGNTCPWAYDFAGAPYLAQKTTRDIVSQLYLDSPGGLPGNDDGGAMSSWYVFAALGLFPEIPGVAGFTVGAPLFKHATITLPDGKLLKINAPGTSDNAYYVHSMAMAGKAYTSSWIPWDLVKGGADIDFAMQSHADTKWASDPVDAPPSFDVK